MGSLLSSSGHVDVINAPPDTVWEAIADVESYPNYIGMVNSVHLEEPVEWKEGSSWKETRTLKEQPHMLYIFHKTITDIKEESEGVRTVRISARYKDETSEVINTRTLTVYPIVEDENNDNEKKKDDESKDDEKNKKDTKKKKSKKDKAKNDDANNDNAENDDAKSNHEKTEDETTTTTTTTTNSSNKAAIKCRLVGTTAWISTPLFGKLKIKQAQTWFQEELEEIAKEAEKRTKSTE